MKYSAGEGLPQDFTQAAAWYRKAADTGNAWGQNSLGYAYACGQGVEQDDVEAVFWYVKAAEQGYSLAQSNLGECYRDGKGVAQDRPEAYKWFALAAAQGDPEAVELRDRLTAELSAEDLAEGNRRAERFRCAESGPS